MALGAAAGLAGTRDGCGPSHAAPAARRPAPGGGRARPRLPLRRPHHTSCKLKAKAHLTKSAAAKSSEYAAMGLNAAIAGLHPESSFAVVPTADTSYFVS